MLIMSLFVYKEGRAIQNVKILLEKENSYNILVKSNLD